MLTCKVGTAGLTYNILLHGNIIHFHLLSLLPSEVTMTTQLLNTINTSTKAISMIGYELR